MALQQYGISDLFLEMYKCTKYKYNNPKLYNCTKTGEAHWPSGAVPSLDPHP